MYPFFRLASCLLVIFICIDTDRVCVDGRRGYLPSHPRPHPKPHLYGSCVIGSLNTDTGLVMGSHDDQSKYIGSYTTDDARECAHKCCEDKSCTLSWFIAVDGYYEEEEDNCFLVNCDAPHVCRLKRSKLKDSITYVFRKSTTPKAKTTTTTTTASTTTTAMTTSPRIDQYSKATANNDLGPDEMKALVERLDSLDVPGKKEIRKVINTVLAKHKTDVSHSSDLSPYGAKVSSRATSPSKSTTAKKHHPQGYD